MRRGSANSIVSYAIGIPCVDVMDRSCVAVCPVDCIYEGNRKLYINPVECIDCGACMTECPMNAVVRVEDVSGRALQMGKDNATFFTSVLPGRTEPIGTPGAAELIGRVGTDTALVQALPGGGQ